MSGNIIDLVHDFEAMQAVQEYYHSTDRDLAELRSDIVLPPQPPRTKSNPVHALQTTLTKGFGREPR